MSKTPRYIIPVSWVRSMVPPHGVDMVVGDIHDMPTLQLERERPAWHYAALTLWAVALSAGLGYVAARLHHPEAYIAAPVVDSRIQEDGR